MIKRTLIFFFLLFVFYCAYVQWLAPDWWSGSQNTGQSNKIIAEKFIYDDTDRKQLIVGSSLASRIVTDSIPNASNLAFGGLSIYDGLKLILSTGKKPEIVLIEMNMVLRHENEEFTSLLEPINYYPHKYIKAFRADKQPIAIIGDLIMNGGFRFKEFLRGKPFKETPPEMSTSTRDLSKKMVREVYLGLSKIPEKKEVDFCFDKLKRDVIKLEKHHIKVIFFEMPIDNQLENLPQPEYIRNTFYKNFSPKKYKYIDRPHWDYCDTIDGLHLALGQAIIYSSYLKDQLSRL